MRNWFLALLLPLFLLACSDDENLVPPSPLPQFKAQITVKKLWTARIGEGVDEAYLSEACGDGALGLRCIG